MNWGLTGLLIVFGAFILLLVFSPNMSCFGRRLKSPFYPLMRRRKAAKAAPDPGSKAIRTEHFGFSLSKDNAAAAKPAQTPAQKKADDYGFKLD